MMTDNVMECNTPTNLSKNAPPVPSTSYEIPKPTKLDFDFIAPIRNITKNVEESTKYPFPSQLLSHYDRECWTVSTDHCYARPWNWRPETSFLRPTKTLFIPKSTSKRRSINPLARIVDSEDVIDVEGDSDDGAPIYDVSKAKAMMEECERYIFSIKGDQHMDENWEDTISRIHWTPTQNRIFNGMVNILNSFHLAKLAQANVKHEPVLRRTVIDKAVQRLRRLMASISWDCKITQWLHHLLIENLQREYLSSYLDILQTLKQKLPSFVEKMMYGPNTSRLGSLNNENLFPVLKRVWDPVAFSLQQDKPKKLPGNPIIVVVHGAAITSKRIHKWVTQLSNLATVVTIPCNMGHRMTMIHCLDQMYTSTRGKIQEIRNDYPGRNIVLLGFNAGSTLALQVAQIEPVLCVICLGFSILTAEGRRGEPDDSLLELQVPVLFVIGQCSNTALQEDLEDLRERMRVETGLVIVGAADDYLRVNKRKKRLEGITQSVVDRCIVDEVGEFLSGVILSPYPPQIRQSPTQLPTEPVLLKKPSKAERKRYNSNTSSLDSEPPSPSPIPPPRIPRPGLNSCSTIGRPPGSKGKNKLEAKWAAQIAQGTSVTSSPPSPPPSVPYTQDTSSNDSTILPPAIEKVIYPLPKKIKTLKPVDKSSRQSTPIKPNHQTQTTAKMQAYGFNRNMMSGPLSTLLQGGIKTIPPSAPKTNSGIKVLENVSLNSNATGKLLSNTGKTLDLSKITVINPVNAGRPGTSMGNVILLPDGKIKTIHGTTVKGTSNSLSQQTNNTNNIPIKTATTTARVRGGKYITSKRQLIGNKPPRPLKKMSYMHPTHIPSPLPPPTNLTTQDIMDLPIIFADDNQVLDSSLPPPEVSTPITSPVSQSPKLVTNTTPTSSKFVLVNKQTPSTGNYVISPPNSMKKSSPINLKQQPQAQQPKYTKIILSKRNSEELKASGSATNIISKLSGLPSEISVKKVSAGEIATSACEQPNTSSYQPTTNSSKSAASGCKLNASGPKPENSYHPATSGYQPTISGYQPTTSGYQPPASGYQLTSGYQPINSGYRSSTSGYHPTKSVYQPSTGYQARASSFQPRMSGYHPTTSSYKPTPSYTPQLLRSEQNNVFEHIDLENELVATAVPKPNLATSDVKNITVFKQQTFNNPIPLNHQMMVNQELMKRAAEEIDDDDPDYIPPKNVKY